MQTTVAARACCQKFGCTRTTNQKRFGGGWFLYCYDHRHLAAPDAYQILQGGKRYLCFLCSHEPHVKQQTLRTANRWRQLVKASTGTLQHLRPATLLQKARAIYLFVLAKSRLNLTSNVSYCGQPTDGDSS